jgi:hypothetical protein
MIWGNFIRVESCMFEKMNAEDVTNLFNFQTRPNFCFVISHLVTI